MNVTVDTCSNTSLNNDLISSKSETSHLIIDDKINNMNIESGSQNSEIVSQVDKSDSSKTGDNKTGDSKPDTSEQTYDDRLNEISLNQSIANYCQEQSSPNAQLDSTSQTSSSYLSMNETEPNDLSTTSKADYPSMASAQANVDSNSKTEQISEPNKNDDEMLYTIKINNFDDFSMAITRINSKTFYFKEVGWFISFKNREVHNRSARKTYKYLDIYFQCNEADLGYRKMKVGFEIRLLSQNKDVPNESRYFEYKFKRNDSVVSCSNFISYDRLTGPNSDFVRSNNNLYVQIYIKELKPN